MRTSIEGSTRTERSRILFPRLDAKSSGFSGDAFAIVRIAGELRRAGVALTAPAAVTTEHDVAEAVWRAANDVTAQLRFPAGADAVALARAS
jgi:hypothetical protein